MTIAVGPLIRKSILTAPAETLPWYRRLCGVMVGASIPAKHHEHGSLCGISRDERFRNWGMAHFLCLALASISRPRLRRGPCKFRSGRSSPGPGSIQRSARKVRVRRAANAVASSDQQGHDRMPQHCGYSHDGNGCEGMAFILEQFKDVTLASPTDSCAFCVPWPTRMIGSR